MRGITSGACGRGCPGQARRRTPYVCLLLLFLCFSGAVPAQARSWNIADYASTISIDDHGAALISEQITVVFVGHFNGIYRQIPIEYPGPKSTNYTLFLDVLRVADDNGVPLKYELSTTQGSRKIKIYIPGAEDTRKTVAITYSVPNAIRYFDDFDEFYWNVTGNDWPVPIDHARAFVTLPPKAAGAGLRAQAFTGMYGSRAQEATSSISESNVAFETTNPLSMRGGLTIDVYIPKGILQKPSVWTHVYWFLKSNPILFLPLATFVVMFGMWYWKGRDPDPGVSVAPMYEPPKGMTPAEVGTLIDDSTDPRDITSILVDLAVRGYLKIREEQVTQLLVFKKKDYIFVQVKGPDQWGDLAPFERVMMENLFPAGVTETHIADLRNRFYVAIQPIKSNVMSTLKDKGMYTLDPESAHGYWILGAVVTAAPFVIVGYFLHVDFSQSGVWMFGAILLAALIVFLFSRVMTAKSLKGVRTRVEILGFQEFMNRVDADRLKRMPPDTFEKYLPYAMALGVEHRWAKAFQGLVQNPPTWYEGSYGPNFSTWMFMNDLGAMTSDTTSALVSTPRASSDSSGFSGSGSDSGGGFSGGGFGGGGGDAF